MYTQHAKNEHFATMKRTARETVAFALFAVVATVVTTLLAVSPARADTRADGSVAKSQWQQGQSFGI
jgi:hypothetical protein